MESYTFELENNVFGYFQRDDNDCFLYIDTGLYSKVNHYQWSHWQQGESNYNENFPGANDNDQIAKAIGYFSWHQFYDRCLYHPIVINLSQKTVSGIFFPRMNRGEPNLFNHHRTNTQILDEIRAFSNICDSLNELFNYIDPDGRNLNCFGNKIREILIIACTEVEYLLQNFLVDNKYLVTTRFSTNDYVTSLRLLKLDNYSTKLVFYPQLQEWSPFSGWDVTKPTASLAWYDAYNAVKHNRGANRQKASLKTVINAVAAIHILLEAQYGREIFNSPMQSSFCSIFKTIQYPSFSVDELQCPAMSQSEILWNHKNYLFQ
ncbi:hypothetical protein [Yersinia ruckeri]|uniref:hypothetical protein n=1 Tax=Yersinia ruckeri TaxID=29486 RepID=UPI0020C098E0|nr:hypothetical protein [Yersinia ruckeri]MCW6525933.1 hypothetical protein [Yersinia ruckeri]MCW6560746.1 hypothetical protein [Yersinia ruckeri]UZY03562.1 hypothetical protein LNQ41_009890 [Yersinia ruckeri]